LSDQVFLSKQINENDIYQNTEEKERCEDFYE